jgi:hypothetical protein
MNIKFHYSLFACLLFFNAITAQNISLVKDILDGSGNGVQTFSEEFASTSNRIYFPGTESGFPVNLCYSDGTSANTKCITTPSSAAPELLMSAGNRVFFKAFGDSGPSLFVAENNNITLTRAFANPYLEEILPFNNNKVLLAINDGAGFDQANQLWISDGTANGTSKLADRTLRLDFMFTTQFGNNAVVYDFSTNSNPFTAFLTDGTSAGTVDVKNYVQPFYEFSSVRRAVGATDLLFVSGQTQQGAGFTAKRIVTDGTLAGTKELSIFGEIRRAIKRDASTYFVFSDTEVGVYNPQTQVYTTLEDNVYVFGQAMLHNNKLYYHTQNSIWESDGTVAGTKNVNVTSLGSNFYTRRMILNGNKLYYTVSSASALELWAHDLTTATNVKWTDIYTNTGLIVTPILSILNGKLVFSRNTDEYGFELWKEGSASSNIVEIQAEALRVFPNPSQGEFKIDMKLEEQGGTLSIYDQQGVLVRQKHQFSGATESLEGLPLGLYIIRYQQQDKHWVAKLILQ